METAKRTFNRISASKNTAKETIKFTTAKLPVALWNVTRLAVALYDRRFLVTSAILALFTTSPFYLLSVLGLSDKFEDFAYGLGYIAIAVGTLFLKNTFHLRQTIVTVLVSIWALRLGVFLLYRAHQMKDFRMEPIRDSVVGISSFWFFQLMETWLNALPVTLLNSFSHNPSIGLSDLIGYALWVVGFSIESLADFQKYQFKQTHKDRWCNVGLYQYSRHPNYFGEILLWFGIFFMVAPTLQGWTWVSILSPIFHAFVMMFISGIPPLESRYNEQWGNNPEYLRYKDMVPILIPAKPHTQLHHVLKKVD